MLKQGAVSGKVMEIQDLQHLESVVDKAGSSLLVVFFYTRSCGVCKELLRDFTQLCEEVSSAPCWLLKGIMKNVVSSGQPGVHVQRHFAVSDSSGSVDGCIVLPSNHALTLVLPCLSGCLCCRPSRSRFVLCLLATT